MAVVYFKIEPGKFIQFDSSNNRAIIIVKSELQQLKASLEARLSAIDPNKPRTNQEWVAWAKAHYPIVDHSSEITELARVQAILDGIKDA